MIQNCTPFPSYLRQVYLISLHMLSVMHKQVDMLRVGDDVGSGMEIMVIYFSLKE